MQQKRIGGDNEERWARIHNGFFNARHDVMGREIGGLLRDLAYTMYIKIVSDAHISTDGRSGGTRGSSVLIDSDDRPLTWYHGMK